MSAAAPTRPHVAVVGAGLAGLAAGLELTRRGCRVTLLERSRLLGGKATSFRIGEIEVDNGQHVVLGCCTSFLSFAEALGMGSKVRLQERFEVLMLSDRGPSRLRALNLPPPLHLAVPFLGFRALRFGARLQVARALVAARRRHPAREEAESFAAWLDRRHQGDEARRAFWEPFIVPALNT
ncbi:MAG: FAD-dependent oxidoreductase, partial [Candidatus Dormiibacterota bacterium]